MDRGFDLAVYDRRGRRTALVEVKAWTGTNSSWAAGHRSSLLRDYEPPEADWFIFLAPDRLYAWRGSAAPGEPPACELDVSPLLAPYFKRVEMTPEQVEPVAFEMLALWWLSDLACATPSQVAPQLRCAGWVQAVSGAEIEREARA